MVRDSGSRQAGSSVRSHASSLTITLVAASRSPRRSKLTTRFQATPQVTVCVFPRYFRALADPSSSCRAASSSWPISNRIAAQVNLGFDGSRMVRARLPRAQFQDFTLNLARLRKIMLLEHDFDHRTQQIDLNRMLKPARGRLIHRSIQGSIQQTNCLIDFTGTPERDGKSIGHREGLRIVRTEQVVMRIQHNHEFVNLRRIHGR